MQSKVRIYAKVLYESLKRVSLAEQRKRIGIFKEILKKRGDIRMSSGVLQEFHRLLQEQKGKIGKVVSSRPLGAPVKTMLQRLLKSMKFVPQDRIEPAVIGGVALFLGREFLIDNTIVARLRKLFYGKRLSF